MTGTEFIGPALGAAAILNSVVLWLSSAGATRTRERFESLETDIKDSNAEVKLLIRVGDADEERRRTESLRDLDARTGKAIDGLRKDIQERIDDLKHTVLAAISHQ